MASRIAIYECCLGPEHPALLALRDAGFEVVACADRLRLLEEVLQSPPDVVIYGLQPGSQEDLGVLGLIRRAAPDLRLVLLAAEGSLDTQRLVQGLRPTYYAVCPVEPAELCEAVRAAVVRPPRPDPTVVRRIRPQ